MNILNIIQLFSKVKSQETQIIEESQLFNNSVILFNKSEGKYQSISEKMKNIKYNIFLKIRYKKLKRKYIKIQDSVVKIKELLESKNYDKNQVKEKITDLNRSIYKFEKSCNKALEVFSQSEKIKEATIKLIKVFFLTILIIIIIILAIIALISFIIYKRKKKYHTLQEEVANISGIEINIGNNSNSTMNRIKVKNEEAEEIEIKRKKKVKKEKIENSTDENNIISIEYRKVN